MQPYQPSQNNFRASFDYHRLPSPLVTKNFPEALNQHPPSQRTTYVAPERDYQYSQIQAKITGMQAILKERQHKFQEQIPSGLSASMQPTHYESRPPQNYLETNRFRQPDKSKTIPIKQTQLRGSCPNIFKVIEIGPRAAKQHETTHQPVSLNATLSHPNSNNTSMSRTVHIPIATESRAFCPPPVTTSISTAGNLQPESPFKSQKPFAKAFNDKYKISHEQSTKSSYDSVSREIPSNDFVPNKSPKSSSKSPNDESKTPDPPKVGSMVKYEQKTFKSLQEVWMNRGGQRKGSVAMPKRSNMVCGFQIGQVLGKGKFGQVFLARHQATGFVVALKRINKDEVRKYKMINQIIKEIKLHGVLSHPNIVQFHGFFEADTSIYLIMEYVNGGTLFKALEECERFTVKRTVNYLCDIICAVEYLHERSIAHRDIKPENIVLSSEGVAKLCDFGWSAIVETSRTTYCGTFEYAPPEILEHKNYDLSVDVWCIGVLTYQLLTGTVPFEGESRTEKIDKIVNLDKNKLVYQVNLPPEAKQFIQSLVQKDPNLRPRVQDLCQFKLITLYRTKEKKALS